MYYDPEPSGRPRSVNGAGTRKMECSGRDSGREIEGGGKLVGKVGKLPLESGDRQRKDGMEWTRTRPTKRGKRGKGGRGGKRSGRAVRNILLKCLLSGLLVGLNDDTHILPITHGRSWEGEIAVSYTPPMTYAMLYYAML